MNRSIAYAFGSALLFGASTPLAKPLLEAVPPLLLGGLLYLGAGLGLLLYRLLRDRGWQGTGLHGRDWLWLGAACACGGVAGTTALMFGLQLSSAASASLLLNLELVFTALLAWLVFREPAGRRVLLGLAAIVAGGVLLAWPQPGAAGLTQGAGAVSGSGAALVALACLCWALDNNLTRKVASADAVFIAASRGLVAGLVICGLALALGSGWPPLDSALKAMTLGLLGYGLSLVWFVLALRGLGAARASAYFASAPFLGVAVALLLLGEATSPVFWLAAALMALGVWLHLGERHAHEHAHEHAHAALAHEHWHVHGHGEDGHHQHPHHPDDPPLQRGAHQHWHQHAALTHQHPHDPDSHHQHRH